MWMVPTSTSQGKFRTYWKIGEFYTNDNFIFILFSRILIDFCSCEIENWEKAGKFVGQKKWKPLCVCVGDLSILFTLWNKLK